MRKVSDREALENIRNAYEDAVYWGYFFDNSEDIAYWENALREAGQEVNA